MGLCSSAPVGAAPLSAEIDHSQLSGGGQKLCKDARLEDVYRIGSTIGSGGFSEVKLVTERPTRQQWACKVLPLPPADSGSKEERRQRRDTLRELNAVLELQHPNVLGMEEYFVEGGKVYLIMELLRAEGWWWMAQEGHRMGMVGPLQETDGGELLDALNREGPYSEAQARTIFLQLIQGVNYLHSMGVIHRDLKLENLLFARTGDIHTLKIAGFGVAVKGSAAALQKLKTVCGSPQYIAPEVIRAGKNRRSYPQAERSPYGSSPESTTTPSNVYGPACDLWSCGVILYMLLSGLPPFWNDSQPLLLEAVCRGEFDFDQPVWRQVSREARDLICKLLVVDPSQRLTPQQVLEHPWLAALLMRSRRRSSRCCGLESEVTLVAASRSVSPAAACLPQPDAWRDE